MIFRMASIRSALTPRPAFEQLNLVDVSERPFALWSHLGSNRFPIKLDLSALPLAWRRACSDGRAPIR